MDGIRPEMSHSSRSHHCSDVSISCLLLKTILYPAVPRLGSHPHLAYLMISHQSSTLQRSGVPSYLQWQNYTNIYSFRNLLFFQDHFSSVLFLHFTLRWRRWEVGKWNWKLVEDTFSFCPSWERMRTLNLIQPQQVTFTWPVASSQPFPWHLVMTATMKADSSNWNML